MAVFGPRRRTLVIPFSTINRVADVLAAKGRVARGYLGLGLQPVKLETGGTGIMAMSVDPKGPGAAAGVRQGDVIVAWNGEADPRAASSPADAGARQRRDFDQAFAEARGRAGRAHADGRRTAGGAVTDEAAAPIVVAIEIGEPVLADRLAALLADVPGLRLAAPGEPADVALVDWRERPEADLALTPREHEVLALLAEGASNKAIARRLMISVNTVKFHIASLFDKLDAEGRTEAVAQAARLGAIKF